MSNLREKEVITLQLQTGLSTQTVSKKVLGGKIVGVAVYHTPIEIANGYVENCSMTIKTDSGEKLIETQPVLNLRSRDASYPDSFVPVDFQGGQNLNFEIKNRVPFATDAVFFDIILIYDETDFIKKSC